jgi:hypothetical protein
MRVRKIAVVAASIAALGATSAAATAAPPAATPAPATQAATRQFEGTIVSVNRSARTFRLRDSQRGTVTIKVTSRTRFQRVGGFAGLRAGQTRIERSGGGGRHGGSDD